MSLRQTGRTTRMMAAAVAYASDNPTHRVVVIVPRHAMIRYVRDTVPDVPKNVSVEIIRESHAYRGYEGLRVFVDHSWYDVEHDELEFHRLQALMAMEGA